MARHLKEPTEIVMGPIMNVILAMMLLAICALMGCKVTDGRGRGRKMGRGHPERRCYETKKGKGYW